MSGRSGLGLIGIIILAIIVGVAAGRSQPPTAAAPMATPTPTPPTAPSSGHVDIVPSTSGGTSVQFLAAGGGSALTVRVGQKVTWTNLDTRSHAVAADNGAFSSSPLSTRQSFTWTPSRPGTYAYSDYMDPKLSGTITVKP